MALEIKELKIKINVSDNKVHNMPQKKVNIDINKLKKDILQECIFTIKEILAEDSQR